MADRKSIADWIALIAPSIALLAPILYVLGYLFNDGYLAEYGVHRDFFQRSAPEYLMLCFQTFLLVMTSLMNFVSKAIIWLFASACACGLITYFVLRLKRSLFNDWFQLKRQAVLASRHAEEIGVSILFGAGALYIPLTIFVVLIVLLLTASTGYFKGQLQAKEEVQKYKDCSVRKADDKRGVGSSLTFDMVCNDGQDHGLSM